MVILLICQAYYIRMLVWVLFVIEFAWLFGCLVEVVLDGLFGCVFGCFVFIVILMCCGWFVCWVWFVLFFWLRWCCVVCISSVVIVLCLFDLLILVVVECLIKLLLLEDDWFGLIWFGLWLFCCLFIVIWVVGVFWGVLCLTVVLRSVKLVFEWFVYWIWLWWWKLVSVVADFGVGTCFVCCLWSLSCVGCCWYLQGWIGYVHLMLVWLVLLIWLFVFLWFVVGCCLYVYLWCFCLMVVIVLFWISFACICCCWFCGFDGLLVLSI